MKKGCKVIHSGSGLKGTVIKVDGSYSWVLLEDGSEAYIYSGELMNQQAYSSPIYTGSSTTTVQWSTTV